MEDKENSIGLVSDIEMLRSRLKDIIETDVEQGEDLNLLRWLKACDLNPKKAERMMRASWGYRKENNFDVVSKIEINPILEKNIPFRMDGFAKDGAPLVTVEGGKIDIRSLVETHGKNEVHRFFMSKMILFEKALVDWNRVNAEAAGLPITKDSFQGAVYIIDWKSLSLRQITSLKCIQVYTQTCKDYISYIPLLASRVIIINCPRFSAPIINLLKTLLEGPNLEIEAYDTNTKKWKEEIHKKIHPDQLGEAFGGTRIYS